MKALVLLLPALAACWQQEPSGPSPSAADVQPLAAGPASRIPLTGRVTDAADILNSAEEASLSDQLEELERSTRHQFVVVTVASLGGMNVSDFARALGNRWGIGRAGHDDGLILLVAPNERKVRIAVGRGLEKKLPDALCRQIMERAIIPRFSEGDLSGGIEAGVKALIRALQERAASSTLRTSSNFESRRA